MLDTEKELYIRIVPDKENKLLIIRDTGIGMTKADMVNNLGTIAKSGTSEFFKSLSGDQQKDSQLIGQFGVGFYSAFIVADRVEVLTRRAGQPPEAGVRWESSADGEYTVETVTRAAFGQRRKMLRQSLKAATPDPTRLLAATGLPETARAEEISVEGFVALARALAG